MSFKSAHTSFCSGLDSAVEGDPPAINAAVVSHVGATCVAWVSSCWTCWRLGRCILRKVCDRHRYLACACAAIAEFVLRSRSPAAGCAVLCDGACVAVTDRYADDLCEGMDVDRDGAIRGAAISERSAAPALRFALVRDCTATSIPSRYRNDTRRQTNHLDGTRAVGGLVVPELPVAIPSPAFETASCGDSAGVSAASRNHGDTGQPRDIGGSMLVGCSVAQLARFASAPAFRPARIRHGARMLPASRNCLYPCREIRYCGRNLPVERGVVPELALVVASPTLHASTFRQSARVEFASRNCHDAGQGAAGNVVGTGILTGGTIADSSIIVQALARDGACSSDAARVEG